MKNSERQTTPARLDTGLVSAESVVAAGAETSNQPAMAPPAMIATCDSGVAQASAITAATAARARRRQSGARRRAMR